LICGAPPSRPALRTPANRRDRFSTAPDHLFSRDTSRAEYWRWVRRLQRQEESHHEAFFVHPRQRPRRIAHGRSSAGPRTPASPTGFRTSLSTHQVKYRASGFQLEAASDSTVMFFETAAGSAAASPEDGKFVPQRAEPDAHSCASASDFHVAQGGQTRNVIFGTLHDTTRLRCDHTNLRGPRCRTQAHRFRSAAEVTCRERAPLASGKNRPDSPNVTVRCRCKTDVADPSTCVDTRGVNPLGPSHNATIVLYTSCPVTQIRCADCAATL